jgi:hypothetical protein
MNATTPFVKPMRESRIAQLEITATYADGSTRTLKLNDPSFEDPTPNGPELAFELTGTRVLAYIRVPAPLTNIELIDVTQPQPEEPR